jgi:DNA-directed RNA polymerase subunit RPC12/RpoP
MGALFKYTCVGCGHAVDVSGGRDWGWNVITRTIRCRGCAELLDVTVAEIGVNAEDASPQGVEMSRISCPKDKGHRVNLWSTRHPCPKCGAKMTRGQMTMLWD